MCKPTIFFSHSSLDKELVITIKNKLNGVTGGVLDIFMSSDGQSIPLGTNWIHKVEEGLQKAKIMFIFVTPNSLSSGWIYFEAGFAYSKGISVVPIGIGIEIGELKAPLNLLQGFNISSYDSLNNLITIINKAFNYNFNLNFNQDDYLEIIGNNSLSNIDVSKFEELVKVIKCEIFDKVRTTSGNTISYDLDSFLERILEYLDKNNYDYSKAVMDSYSNSIQLVTTGIRIIYKKKSIPAHISDENVNISFYISPINFIKSFSLFIELMGLLEDREYGYVLIKLKSNYEYVNSEENVSSILSEYTEFEAIKDNINSFKHRDYDLRLKVFEPKSDTSRFNNADYFGSISFKINAIKASNIIKLLYRLREIGFIDEKWKSE